MKGRHLTYCQPGAPAGWLIIRVCLLPYKQIYLSSEGVEKNLESYPSVLIVIVLARSQYGIIVAVSLVFCGTVEVCRTCFKILSGVLCWVGGENGNQAELGYPASARTFGYTC